ncbi:hypothetical protein MY04_1596 [Flammeovirga sp. MY04]|uniref:hypothetical protein n=1 Tax=Flammeovirga sp. MY04 TaxID=1191459 RepID=UPI0008060E02|nr:hypothetical protein [Flammeovirga sp. MY04]ANQ48970.1 hypothetical protein MY04_1596 [Flammeovirga sp. MY04]
MITITKKLKNLLFLPLLNILVFACEQPMDPVIETVQNTKSILNEHQWYLNNFEVITKSDDIAPPILWSAASSDILSGGTYDLSDMVFEDLDNQSFFHQFTTSGDITTSHHDYNFLTDSIGRYFIINDQKIRITNSSINLNYEYQYDEDLKQFRLHVNEESAASLIKDANEKLVKYVANGTPDKIGGLVTKLLYHNETVQRLINNALVGWLAGKGEFIEHLPPEETADAISEELFKFLESLEIEAKLSEVLKTELDKIIDFDSDELSRQLSQEIAQLVQSSLSKEKIYDFIYPKLDEIVSSPEEGADTITSFIMNVISEILTEDRIMPISEKIWDEYTQLDAETISSVSSSITSLLEDNFLNVETFYNIIYPTVSKIEDTSILKMGELAEETTNKIEVIINTINNTFDGIDLNPDYESMTSTLKTAFIAAKPVISLNGGAEKTTQEISELIKNQFLSTEFIHQTINSGLTQLQSVDSETAAPIITSLISALADIASPTIHEYISSKLLLIIDGTDAEYLSFKISKTVSDAITSIVNEENVYGILFPVIDGIANLDTQLIADKIANMIMELDIIKDNINQENVSKVIQEVLINIQDTGVENIVQSLVTALAKSSLFTEVITEERLSLVISLLLYNSAYQDVKVANNFTSATIILEHR